MEVESKRTRSFTAQGKRLAEFESMKFRGRIWGAVSGDIQVSRNGETIFRQPQLRKRMV